MKINNIDIHKVLDQSREALEKDKKMAPSTRLLIQFLLTVIELLVGKSGKNSKNSSIPPSQDPHRKKSSNALGKKKPGGQVGHVGVTLTQFEGVDEIIDVPVDLKSLPSGHVYKEVGFNKRQVVEINLSRIVKEYRLQIVEDETGKQYTAEAPEGLSRPIQYGQSVKAMSVYMSLYQLIPYGRVEEYFRNQVGIPVSAGSLCNFNKEAFEKLARFEEIAKKKLKGSAFIHTDETSINVNSKTTWLHNASNDKWTLFAPHAKRGTEAMDAIGILPEFKGVMIHDHWKPYYTYTTCQHALCNAHHLRELQAVIELAPDHAWAQNLKDLLLAINEATQKADGVLPKEIADNYRACYREIIKVGELECPLPPAPELPKKKRGKIKKSKERNLLERLRNFEDDVLRFMIVKYVPFTNNQGENDIRMTKVQQKISGCFKSFEGAQIFCLVRSYLLTCKKHNLSATDALDILFKGNLPDFCL